MLHLEQSKARQNYNAKSENMNFEKRKMNERFFFFVSRYNPITAKLDSSNFEANTYVSRETHRPSSFEHDTKLDAS